MIDEQDLALVHALQVRPRAAWTELAEVLGCTPATAARRWERLSRGGAAWVAAVPGPHASAFVAFVGLRCAAGRRRDVAAALAEDPAAVTVEITAGGHELVVEVVAPDVAAFGRYLLDRVERLPGVTSSSVTVATSIVGEASRWRLDALDAGQLGELATAGPGRRPPRRPSDVDQRLLVELGRDGRMPWHRLAERTGTSAATARRRTERLLASGEAVLRCDIAAPRFEWPVTTYLWCRVPAPDLDGVARSLTTASRVRFVATLAGAHNLLVTAWLRAVEEVHRLEVDLAARHPALEVLDRTITLESPKRMGRVFDGTGLAVRTVPLGPWGHRADPSDPRDDE
ncbi:Lrp/AsnC family transcriptional regulator [Saccharopolyspora rosea]|uniref:Lrp/AsnC family transcriptional regulator n=1 Tax=Saccharopolyspora rosea TaxID=524884 RepID=A0ABW3FV09_9PSEU|nr:Lrp/AsnC family transcriptional regulator [Saccharopolyspora rosea]